jgi:hypothetical protein
MGVFGQQPRRPRLDIDDIVETAHNLQNKLEDRVVESGGLSDYQALTLALKMHISDLDQSDRDTQDENLHGFAQMLAGTFSGD